VLFRSVTDRSECHDGIIGHALDLSEITPSLGFATLWKLENCAYGNRYRLLTRRRWIE